MTPPTPRDRHDGTGQTAEKMLSAIDPVAVGWMLADLRQVEGNLSEANYASERVHYIVGPVEETLPARAPHDGIAILRLGTDWYESTRHGLRHLYHRMVPGGVLLVEDYGFWEGARATTDEFLGGLDRNPLLVRVDPTARICVVR